MRCQSKRWIGLTAAALLAFSSPLCGSTVLAAESGGTQAGAAAQTITIKGSSTETKPTETQSTETVTLAASVITKAENVSKGIKLTWIKVMGATGYQIFCDTGKDISVKVISSAAATSWTDTSAKINGKVYGYTVYACQGETLGPASNKRTICRLLAPKVTSVKSKGGKWAVLKWNKNKKSSGYQVQSSADPKFKNAKTVQVSGAKKTSQTIAGLKAGKKYYLRIRCYKKSGKKMEMSAWSKVKSIKITR